MTQELTDIELDFLRHSNWIEDERSEVALADAINAWEYIKSKKHLSVHAVLGVHKRLAENLRPDIAGQLRTVAVMVGGKICPNPASVPYLLLDLLTKNGKPRSEWDIKEWHIAYEWMHPHEDFNGRTGRIIMNWQRITNNLPILVIHEGEEQSGYYTWFQTPEKNKYLKKLGRF